MTLEEFEAGMDSWGGDLEAWPAPERMAATVLLAGSPAARRSLAAMLAVEHALARTARRELPGLDGLLARATAERQETAAGPRAWRLRYAAAAVAVLAAGYAYGALTPAAAEDWFGAAFAPPEVFDVN
jgi:hypothetical protein